MCRFVPLTSDTGEADMVENSRKQENIVNEAWNINCDRETLQGLDEDIRIAFQNDILKAFCSIHNDSLFTYQGLSGSKVAENLLQAQFMGQDKWSPAIATIAPN